MEANHRAVFRDGLLWRFLLGVLVVGALRGVLVVVAQPGELLVEGLDGGFLLAENLFDQVMPVGFERLLLGKEFFDVVFWHRSIIRQERGRMQGPESHRSPRPLRFRQKLASVYVFRPRLLENAYLTARPGKPAPSSVPKKREKAAHGSITIIE
jgi:hypothetical protein